MRVLLDENVPRKLKHRLGPEHGVVTVPERGWSGLLNGALLRAGSNKYEALLPLVPSTHAALSRLGPGSLVHVAG